MKTKKSYSELGSFIFAATIMMTSLFASQSSAGLSDAVAQGYKLAPQSPFQTKDASVDKRAARMPGVRPVEGMAMSFDNQILDAESSGKARPLEKTEIARLIYQFETTVMDSPNLEEFLNTARARFQNLFPEARHEVKAKDLRSALIKALGLLRTGQLEIYIDSSLVQRPEYETPWGYHAGRNEIHTDSGLDASNLPFLARRIGNKIYIRKQFFDTFARYTPDQSGVFWEVFLHDLLEDTAVTGPLGISPERAHAFAAMMSDAARVNLPEGTTGYSDLHRWIIRFYTPRQLADMLRYHPGLQAQVWRERALEALLKLGEIDLVVSRVNEILNKGAGVTSEEKKSDNGVLDRLDAQAKGASAGSPAALVMAKFEPAQEGPMVQDTAVPVEVLPRAPEAAAVISRVVEEPADEPVETEAPPSAVVEASSSPEAAVLQPVVQETVAPVETVSPATEIAAVMPPVVEEPAGRQVEPVVIADREPEAPISPETTLIPVGSEFQDIKALVASNEEKAIAIVKRHKVALKQELEMAWQESFERARNAIGFRGTYGKEEYTKEFEEILERILGGTYYPKESNESYRDLDREEYEEQMDQERADDVRRGNAVKRFVSKVRRYIYDRKLDKLRNFLESHDRPGDVDAVIEELLEEIAMTSKGTSERTTRLPSDINLEIEQMSTNDGIKELLSSAENIVKLLGEPQKKGDSLKNLTEISL